MTCVPHKRKQWQQMSHKIILHISIISHTLKSEEVNMLHLSYTPLVTRCYRQRKMQETSPQKNAITKSEGSHTLLSKDITN